MIIWPAKDPAATEKFEFLFADRLGADTISSATLVPDGVTVTSLLVGTDKVDFELSGGTQGTVATVTCTAVTSGGETIVVLGVLPIGGEVVDLATAKQAQKIEDDEEDALLAAYLRAAIRTIEKKISKNLTQQVETQKVAGFPGRVFGGCPHPGQMWSAGPTDAPIRLYKGPVSSILEVKYDDGDGVEQTLSSFRLVEGKNAQLLPAYGASWPVTARGAGTVRISYVAGFDPTDRDLDLAVQAAILLFGHFNANREAVLADTRAAAVELPLGVQMLIEDLCPPGLA